MNQLLAIVILIPTILCAQSYRTVHTAASVGYTFAFDAASSASTTDGSELVWNHTVTASSGNRALYVGVSYWSCSTISTSSVLYNGVSMSLVGEYCAASTQYVAIYKLLNPSTGMHAIDATLSGNPHSFVCGAWSFTGVNQSTPNGTFASVTDYDIMASLTVSGASGDIAIGIACNGGVLFTGSVGTGQTSDWALLGTGGYIGGAGVHGTLPSTTTILQSSMNAEKQFTMGGVAIKGN